MQQGEKTGTPEAATRDFSGVHRYTYADYSLRVGKLSNALKRLGVRRSHVSTTRTGAHAAASVVLEGDIST